MPTTESPAPRSKRVSVSEGTSETTRTPSAYFFSVFRIEGVDQTVAEEVEAHHREHDRGTGEDRQVIGQAEVAAAGSQHRAPRRRRRLHAESEERKRRLGQNRAGQ